MRTVIRALWESPVVWRYVDAFGPRLFGLVIHSLLVWQYGTEEYALPTWCLGTLAIVLGLIPDPHSYILIRRHGAGARRLLALTSVWVWAKLLLASAVCWLSCRLFATQVILDPHGDQVWLVVAATTLYGSVEAAWGVIGTVSLAVGNVRQVAIAGFISRSIGVALVASCYLLKRSALGFDLLLLSVPTAVALGVMTPVSTRVRRNVTFMWFATKRYGIWSQGVALFTGLLMQAPILAMGSLPIATAAAVGQVAYVTRLISAAIQPLQILQSLVIREFAVTKQRSTNRLKQLRRATRVGAALITGVGIASLWLLARRGTFEPGVPVIVTTLVGGVALSAWFRFELCEVLATQRIRELFLFGYLPSLLGATIVAAIVIPLIGIAGLGVGVAVAWLGMSLSWMWARPLNAYVD